MIIYPDENIREYVTYDLNSVKLFKNNVSEDAFKVSWAKNKDDYKANWNVEVDGKPTRFKITGTDNNPIILNPGDTIYATYSVIVTPEAFAKIQNNSVAVKNRYLVKASNTNNRADDWALDKFWHIENINTYKWDAKSVGSAIAKDTTIQMSGNKYIKDNGKYKVDNSTENTFKVPKDSYPYTVMVNDTLGDWDATSVQMSDQLNSNKMQYVGYVKIEALEVKQNGSSLASTGDYEKTNTLDRTYESKGVKWVRIDGDTSFTLKPSDLGWENNKYAYRFTYYAKPVNQDSYGSTKVTNTFTLTGNVVGRNGKSFDISNISSNKEVTITGHYQMNVKKSSWYYESPKVDSENWSKGKIYWVVEVSGTAIKKGTIFKDTIVKDKTASNLYNDSLVGIYKGKLPDDKSITSFKDLEELKTTSGLVDVKGEFSNLKMGVRTNSWTLLFQISPRLCLYSIGLK